MPPDRAQLQREQLGKLNALLTAIIPANPFYTRKLHAAQGERSPRFAGLEEFAARVPFTTKQELVADQQAHPPYGTNLTFPVSRYTRFCQTSATTGRPLRWLDTPASWDWMLRCWEQVYRATGVGEADRVFCAFSFGPFLGFWLAFESAQRLGCLCLPGGGLSSAARLRMIIENEVTVLCCTPTYALRLAEVAAQEGVDLRTARVKTVIVAGEPGGSIPSTRARLKQAWPGARPFDHHGLTELGPVTYEWPDQPGMLAVIESDYIAEIVDPATGAEVEAGQVGELVLTNLGRTGSPLLRYRTADLVRKAFIGGQLALDGGILSRTDNMVVVRGVNVYPSAVEELVRAHPEVAEYRVEIHAQHPLTELQVIIEPVAGCADAAALARRIEAEFRNVFALRIPVGLAAPGSLPRFELKAMRWVRPGSPPT
jgi:phenylacetate-CoA ligase